MIAVQIQHGHATAVVMHEDANDFRTVNGALILMQRDGRWWRDVFAYAPGVWNTARRGEPVSVSETLRQFEKRDEHS